MKQHSNEIDTIKGTKQTYMHQNNVQKSTKYIVDRSAYLSSIGYFRYQEKGDVAFFITPF